MRRRSDFSSTTWIAGLCELDARDYYLPAIFPRERIVAAFDKYLEWSDGLVSYPGNYYMAVAALAGCYGNKTVADLLGLKDLPYVLSTDRSLPWRVWNALVALKRPDLWGPVRTLGEAKGASKIIYIVREGGLDFLLSFLRLVGRRFLPQGPEKGHRIWTKGGYWLPHMHLARILFLGETPVRRCFTRSQQALVPHIPEIEQAMRRAVSRDDELFPHQVVRRVLYVARSVAARYLKRKVVGVQTLSWILQLYIPLGRGGRLVTWAAPYGYRWFRACERRVPRVWGWAGHEPLH